MWAVPRTETAGRSRLLLVVLGLLGIGWHALLFYLGRDVDARALAGDEQTYWAKAELYFAGSAPEPDPLWPPFYARFLNFCWQLAGHPSRWVVELVQVLLLALAAYLLSRLARREGLPPRPAAAAGWVLFLLPTTASFAHYFWPEILHLAIFLMVLELLQTGSGPGRGFLAGALLALALLTKSLLTGFLPLLLFLDLRTAPADRRLARFLAVIAGLLLVLCPALWQSYRETGQPRLANSSTFNLWVGLNDQSRQSHVFSIAWREHQAFTQSAPDPAGRDAVLRAKIAALVQAEGVPRLILRQLGRQYFRLFEKDSYFTDQLPEGSLQAEGQGYRGVSAAMARPLRHLAWACHLLVLGLAGFGLVLAPPRWERPFSLLLPAFLLYNLALFLGLHVKSRYLVQLLPFLILAAVSGAHTWLGSEKIPRRRLWTGAVVTALLLFCATAGPWLDRLAHSHP